jgi:hypothetical protein
MRRTALMVLGLLIMTFASACPAVACGCGDFLVEDASKASASIFIGEVVGVSDSREMLIGSKTEKVYLSRFLVLERWKGAKSIEAEVLIDLPGHYVQMSVGEVYLVYATPLALEDASTKIEGIVTRCTRTALIERPGPRQKTVNPLPFFDVFKLDKIFKSTAQSTSIFQRYEKLKSFCLVCCF